MAHVPGLHPGDDGSIPSSRPTVPAVEQWLAPGRQKIRKSLGPALASMRFAMRMY